MYSRNTHCDGAICVCVLPAIRAQVLLFVAFASLFDVRFFTIDLQLIMRGQWLISDFSFARRPTATRKKTKLALAQRQAVPFPACRRAGQRSLFRGAGGRRARGASADLFWKNLKPGLSASFCDPGRLLIHLARCAVPRFWSVLWPCVTSILYFYLPARGAVG